MADGLVSRLEEIAESQRNRLARMRVGAGLTQREVAEALGVSQPAVAKWERENDPGDAWLRLAKLYGVRESYPAAPFNPAKRKAFFEGRLGAVPVAPASGTFGKGVR